MAAKSRCRRSPTRLALAAQPVALAFAALLLQKGVERIPCRKLRDRHHEVAPGVAHKALDIPFVIALSGTAISIADQVVGQEAAEQRRPLAGAVGQDLGNKAAIVVIDDRLRHAPEEGECMDVTVHPGLGHRRRIGPNIAAITMRKIQHEEAGLLLYTTDHHHRLAEIGLRVARRMGKWHEHFLPALIPLAHVVLDDRVAAGEPALVAQAVKYPPGGMALLARHLQVLVEPMLDRRNKRIQLRAPDR